MRITLHDYILWTAEREEDITTELIAEQLILEDMDADQIQAFYNKYKNTELRDFKETYESGEYRGDGYDDTTVSFYINNMHFVIPDVNGSFLHDNQPNALISLNNIAKLTDDLRGEFNDLRLHISEEEMHGRTVEVDGETLTTEEIDKYLGYLNKIRKFALYV